MSAFRNSLLVCLLFASSAQAASGLATTFSHDDARTQLYASTCGSVGGGSGCYGFSVLGPFKQACALVATPVASATVNGITTQTRRLAVMDRGTAMTDSVQLSVYQEKITINRADATVTTRLLKKLALPVVGGPSADCSMAQNASGFYVGTDKSTEAVRVDPRFSVTTLPGFSPAMPVGSITSTAGGFVAVTHKDSVFGGAFTLYDNRGAGVETGGGYEFVVGSGNAVGLGGAAVASASAVAEPAAQIVGPFGAVENGAVRSASGEVFKKDRPMPADALPEQ